VLTEHTTSIIYILKSKHFLYLRLLQISSENSKSVVRKEYKQISTCLVQHTSFVLLLFLGYKTAVTWLYSTESVGNLNKLLFFFFHSCHHSAPSPLLHSSISSNGRGAARLVHWVIQAKALCAIFLGS